MTDFPLLTLMLFVPLAGALAVAFAPREDELLKRLGLVFSVLTFAVSLAVLWHFDGDAAGFQLVERLDWVKQWGISYHLGVDGISILLVVLTTFLFPICFLASRGVERRVKEYVIALLLTEWAIIGVFCAMDMVLFYIFWEAVLIPMYLLIGIWGYERRIYATIKFFLYTLAGGLLMLVGIVATHIAIGNATGEATFSYQAWAAIAPQIAFGTQAWLFAAFAIGFAIKVPIFPFHTWLPDAHTEAPTAGSVVLAGVLLKMGTYAFIRFSIPFFPEVAKEAAPYMMAAAVVGILYGAAVSVVQTDLKRLVAYSSVSHLGFVILGLFSFTQAGMEGSVIQMVNHGLSTGALFLLVGMLYERRHTRQIGDFGGLASSAPVYSGVFLIVALSSLGLPGLNGFVGEFLILLGTFETNRVAAIAGAGGVVGAALYLLWAYQRAFHGPITNDANRDVADLTTRERLVLAPVLFLIVLMGVWPRPFLDKIGPAVSRVVETVGVQSERAPAPAPQPPADHGGGH